MPRHTSTNIFPPKLQQLNCFPKNFEEKVGFDKVRLLLLEKAASAMGKERIAKLSPSVKKGTITRRMASIAEMMQILREAKPFPSLHLSDLRKELDYIRVEGTAFPEEQLKNLLHLLRCSNALSRFLGQKHEDDSLLYPSLAHLLSNGIDELDPIEKELDKLIDDSGRIKDNASKELANIRTEISSVERRTSQIIRKLLAHAIKEGWTDEAALPTLRDGHAVIPINPAFKRSMPGVVHDESSTGKTIFVEPLEAVENNNQLRELHAAERREILRILLLFTNNVRPLVDNLLEVYKMIGTYDAITAIAKFANEEEAVVPQIVSKPFLQWKQARHPILRRSLLAQERHIVPLDISLNAPEQRILVISGPNAGGKSVCLKTCAIIQYMVQCGIPVPIHPDSVVGLFSQLAINIGDDQSIEDDLSTYSSHLRAMATFTKIANPSTLLMIDEFGAGTEPELGGAIAEALLTHFNDKKSFAIVNTHYRNLKQLASVTDGMVNGAMLYDRGAMQPMFTLTIGQPGSSFAMQIAKRSGLPNDVLEKAKEIVGMGVIDTDTYVQDIARDKRYWEKKRDEIRKKEKILEEEVEQYSIKLKGIETERKKLLEQAKEQAATIIKDSNALIERTIREIKEANAEREETLAARAKINSFAQQLEVDERESAEQTSKELEKIRREREKVERRAQRKAEKKKKQPEKDSSSLPKEQVPSTPSFAVGDRVMMLPENIEASILEIKENSVLLAISDNFTARKTFQDLKPLGTSDHKRSPKPNNQLTGHLHSKKIHFTEEIDVRGMRAEEAIRAVDFFIDEALQVGCSQVRILHGTGTGALRMTIRQWLSANPVVKSFRDEDVRLGGTGITIVNL